MQRCPHFRRLAHLISYNLPGKHQTCQAHLFRKIRDLYQNGNLPKSETLFIQSWYQQFCSIYSYLRHCLNQPYNRQTRQQQTAEIDKQIESLINQIQDSQPVKLTNLRSQLQRDRDIPLLACLSENRPCDNN